VASKWVGFVGIFLSCFRERGKRKAGEGNLLLPLLRVSRGRRRPTMSFKTTPFGYFFFETVDETSPFHLKEMVPKTCQHPTQSSICDLFNEVLNNNFDFKYQFNCILAKFNCRSRSWPPFSH
jgi:hypothetical protein